MKLLFWPVTVVQIISICIVGNKVDKMTKKYGGVNNKKTINQIQEAVVVGAPIVQKKMPKSKAGVICGWIVYYIVTFIITELLLVITTISEQPFYHSLPLVVSLWLIPSLPFLLTLLILVLQSILRKKKAGS